MSPDVVDLIAFCTKNPAPMLPHMDVLKPYGKYWFVTITPYGKKEFIRIGKKNGMTIPIRPCAEGDELATYGADCSGCMTVNTFETALHSKLNVPKRKTNQRNGQCACLLGTDIGAYDTCGHLCRYCYANANAALVKANMRMHDPDSPFLLGGRLPGDVIREAKQESWIDRQLMLTF